MKTLKFLFILTVSIFFIACDKENSDNGDSAGKSEFVYKELIQPRLDCMNMPRPTDSYNYPVYPGMEEWSQFETVQEMIDACQVPVEVLKKLSTQAVIQAIWEYPFLLDVLHRYQYQMDFDATFLQNNAYNELIERADAGAVLLERLILVNPVFPEARFEPKALELLISQPVFLSQLNDNAKKALIKTTLKNDNLREEDTVLTNNFRATAWLLIGKTMQNANYAPFVEEINRSEILKWYLESKSHVYIDDISGEIPQLIIIYAEDYVNKN
jgi:hypothetical protein